MSLHSSADTLTCSCRRLVRDAERFQTRPQLEMPPARMLDQRPPHRRREPLLDQQVPEPVRSLVEIAHREIREHCPAIAGTPLPDRRVREQLVVAPGVAVIELLTGHVFWLEDDVRRVVLVPVAVQDASLRVELTEQRRAWIRREDVERRALEPVLFDPLHRALEDVRTVEIEAEHEAAAHLDAIALQQRDAARVVVGRWRALPRVREI